MDKSKGESGVLVVERWAVSRQPRNCSFRCSEVNQVQCDLLPDLNLHPLKKLLGCRAIASAKVDWPVLRLLPELPIEYAESTVLRAGDDYHVDIGGHY
ncbi:hypothetical protein [Duganella vulcania]|uniref:Uncharacterized protein n=1 Tax=Duganella vulcania TaxID=2692166 RepID=A0A845GEH0_9BURK|nr:hypothetical protein [Duganella vulcania]MYM92694.1 hypothetical protein [Duganella vulcania]